MAHRRHLVIAVSLTTLWVVQAGAQVGGSATMAPVNDLPNPYQTITGWAKLPEGRTWGSTSAVEIDKDGVSIWVAERCGQNSCTGSDLPAILKFLKPQDSQAMPQDAEVLFNLAMTFVETSHPIDLGWGDTDFPGAYRWQAFEFRSVSKGSRVKRVTPS